ASRAKMNPLTSAPSSPSGSNQVPIVTRVPLKKPSSRSGPTSGIVFVPPGMPAPGMFGLPLTRSGGTGTSRNRQYRKPARTHDSAATRGCHGRQSGEHGSNANPHGSAVGPDAGAPGGIPPGGSMSGSIAPGAGTYAL